MRHAPIVALTANATKSDIDKCLSSGMNDYLPKPFTPDDLYRKIFRDLKIKKQKNGSPNKSPTERKADFDLAYLRNISDNNQDFLQEMIQTFVQSIPPVLKEMEQALTDRNWKKLSLLAHQIKPSFTLLGIEVLRKTVFLIEEHADQKTGLAELVSTTQSFIQDCKKVVADLKKEIIST
jgi:HPt (histidine-containing phosphotransfer) domain-containing protein